MPLDQDASPIQINVRVRSAKARDPKVATIVVFARKGKSKTEIAGAGPDIDKKLSEIADSLLQSGLSLEDLKKNGTFLRLADLNGYQNVAVFGLDEKVKSHE